MLGWNIALEGVYMLIGLVPVRGGIDNNLFHATCDVHGRYTYSDVTLCN